MTSLAEPKLPRLLLIEDQTIQKSQMLQVLRSFGYTNLATSSSCEEALGHIEERRPDLILTNQRFWQGMAGIELIERIRVRFAIPVVLVTGAFTREVPPSLRNSSGIYLLPKPFLPFQLPLYVEMALGAAV